jgi:hypothetical protein
MDIPFAFLSRFILGCFSCACHIGIFLSGLEGDAFNFQLRAFQRWSYHFWSYSLGPLPVYFWHGSPCP